MSGWKSWARRGIAIVVFVIVLAAALCVAGLLPYFLAASTASIPLLVLSSILSFSLIAWAGARGAAAFWRASSGGRFAFHLTVALTVILAAALYLTILRPSAMHLSDPPPFANTRYWQIPTGSRIAYSEYDPPVGVAVNPSPIVYLHGGPGARQAQFDQDIYGEFASNGFRVFLFDQAGSGLSGFLPHIRDYSVVRFVDDLEAVRQKIGAEKMILIGHSWGSTLAASYMAKYPEHVAKVVFHSPARIWNWHNETVDFARTDGGYFSLPAPRLLAALLLRDRNSDAAENLLPQREAQELFKPFLLQTAGTVVCKGDSDKLPSEIVSAKEENINPGFSPYVLQELYPATDNPQGDPHSALRGNYTPAIVLYPECNYLSWNGSIDYRNTFPNLKIYYIPRAGHYVQFEQPELMKRVILAFLLDQPDVIPPYTSDVDPRTTSR